MSSDMEGELSRTEGMFNVRCPREPSPGVAPAPLNCTSQRGSALCSVLFETRSGEVGAVETWLIKLPLVARDDVFDEEGERAGGGRNEGARRAMGG
jgi:hypothetical protein